MTTTFEERALVALKEIVTEPPRRRPARTIVAVGATVAALAAGGVAVAVASAPSPAFAVKSNDDGTVTVTVRSWNDAAGLERELGQRGVTTVAAYIPPMKQCVAGWYKPVKRKIVDVLGETKSDSDGVTFVINKKELHAGETLILMPTGPSPDVPLGRKDDRDLAFASPIVGYSVATGQVGTCVLEDVMLPK
jgi:hypothetical protein